MFLKRVLLVFLAVVVLAQDEPEQPTYCYECSSASSEGCDIDFDVNNVRQARCFDIQPVCMTKTIQKPDGTLLLKRNCAMLEECLNLGTETIQCDTCTSDLCNDHDFATLDV